MRRANKETGLDRTLHGIISRAAADIAHAVRQNIAQEVTRLVGGAQAAGGAVLESAKGQKLGRKRRLILCPVEGCGKPGGGPKWGWFCKNHKDLSEAEKRRAREAGRPRPGAAAAAKRARKRGKR